MNGVYSKRDQVIIDALREALRKRLGPNKSILGGNTLLQWLLSYFKKSGFEFDFEDIELAFSALRSSGEIKAKDWSDSAPGHPLQGRVYLNLTPLPREPHIQWWEDVVDAASLTTEAKKVLRKTNVANRIRGLSRPEMERVLNGLIRLGTSSQSGATEYVASANSLLSSSKLMGVFGKAERDALGLNGNSFKASPKYIAVAGPKHPKCVLYIENPQSFEQAIEAGVSETIALVSVYGYGLASMAKKEIESFWGESIGSEGASLIPLVRSDSPPSLDKLFRMQDSFWWGDLDLAGVDIFQRLKVRLPALQFSALYAPMVEIIQDGGGHPYIKCTGKEDQLKRFTGTAWWEPEAKKLAQICSHHAVDQEAVSILDIKEMADMPLNI